MFSLIFLHSNVSSHKVFSFHPLWRIESSHKMLYTYHLYAKASSCRTFTFKRFCTKFKSSRWIISYHRLLTNASSFTNFLSIVLIQNYLPARRFFFSVFVRKGIFSQDVLFKCFCKKRFFILKNFLQLFFVLNCLSSARLCVPSFAYQISLTHDSFSQ